METAKPMKIANAIELVQININNNRLFTKKQKKYPGKVRTGKFKEKYERDEGDRMLREALSEFKRQGKMRWWKKMSSGTYSTKNSKFKDVKSDDEDDDIYIEQQIKRSKHYDETIDYSSEDSDEHPEERIFDNIDNHTL